MGINSNIDPVQGREQKPGRRERKRAENREKLMSAARVLFADHGVEETTIQEITDEADLGFGTFYNHFDDKDQLIDEVLAHTVATQGALINEITETIEDPAEVIAVSHRYFIRLADQDPRWAWLLVRLELSHDIALRSLAPFARRNLRRGSETGRLKLVDQELALVSNGGALLAVMRAVLDGNAPVNADVLHAEGILRMLGLSAEDAHDVANRDFPRAAASSSATL